jgi:hypothetical protein
MTDTRGSKPGRMLQSLRGARAQASLGQDLEALLTWPPPVLQQLGELLELALSPQLDDRLTTRLSRVAREHDVETDLLLPPLKALRFLLREGAKNNAGGNAFAEDVRTITAPEHHDALLGMLAPFAEQAFPALRKELLVRSIAEHGNVVRDVHWRTDLMQSSDHALGLDVTLTSLTFNYQDGPTPRRITLQLLPGELGLLQKAISAALEHAR